MDDAKEWGLGPPAACPDGRAVAEVMAENQQLRAEVARLRGRAVAGWCEECGGSGYAVHPDNGRNKDSRRCPRGCPVSCSICNNSDCDNPGGQH